MKIIEFKTTYPTLKCMDKIISELKDVDDIVQVSGEFICKIPRHNLITIILEDNVSDETIFELGRLVQIFDKD